MRLIVLIAFGGAAGAVARYALSGVVQPSGSTFPWGTLTVNIVGAFALGFLMRYLLGSAIASADLRLALTIGFCGSFTTMSTFSYETVTLMQIGAYWRAAGYVAGSLGGTVLAVVAGGVLGGRLL
jgi:fluoride exporter